MEYLLHARHHAKNHRYKGSKQCSASSRGCWSNRKDRPVIQDSNTCDWAFRGWRGN